MLDASWYMRVMDEIGPRLTPTSRCISKGEPLLHPDFAKLVKKASTMGIYTATSSNAHHISPSKAREIIESGISRFIISLDGVDQETYAHYRVGGDLDKVLSGTKELVNAKRQLGGKTHIIWQFIVFKHNESQLKAIRQLAKDYGVDELKIKTAQVYDLANGEDWIPESEAYRRYEYTEAAGFSIKNKLLNHCWRLWHACGSHGMGNWCHVVSIKTPVTP
jgi:MoaA/NifB/PqqE/SkfB family radical SAM enzyme